MNGRDASDSVSDNRLVAELWTLGVPFVGGAMETGTEALSPIRLLSGLASSPDARVQLGLIPLLLRRPEKAVALQEAAMSLGGQARIRLMCYATAAALLQVEHWERLLLATHATELLPDFFSSDLALAPDNDPDRRLDALAARQAVLSGRDLNWRGTYESAAVRLLTRLEREAAWTA
ncbi:MAG: hypothetical protein ABIQ99_06905 [Thermoflexales bacterium]